MDSSKFGRQTSAQSGNIQYGIAESTLAIPALVANTGILITSSATDDFISGEFKFAHDCIERYDQGQGKYANKQAKLVAEDTLSWPGKSLKRKPDQSGNKSVGKRPKYHQSAMNHYFK